MDQTYLGQTYLGEDADGRKLGSAAPREPGGRCRPARLLSAALGALMSLSAFPAVAADDGAAQQWNVAERARPAYDPAGIRAGSFLLFPSVELGVSRDDNIYRKRQGEERDSIRSVRPRLYGVSQWRNHEINLDAGVDATFFGKSGKEDATNWFASAAGRLDITRDAWVRAAVGLRELHEERGDPNSPRTATRPVSRQLLSARVEAFRRVSRLSLGVEGRYADIAYEDAVETVGGGRVVQNDRDRGQGEVAARIGWELAPGYEAFVRATRNIRRYDRLQGEDRYDRDSDGTQVAAGARLDLGSVLSGDLFVGYRKQAYEDDDRLPTAEGLSYGGSLTWNVTPLTTVHGTARRTVDESTLRRASGYLSTALQFGVDHELRRNLLIGASIGLTNNRYEGIAREDDILSGSIRGTWLIRRNLHMDFGYRLQQRDSTVARDDYDKNFVWLNVRVQI